MPLSPFSFNICTTLLVEWIFRVLFCKKETFQRLNLPALVVYVKHAYPVSKRTRLDTWLGPILPTLAYNIILDTKGTIVAMGYTQRVSFFTILGEQVST